MESYILISNLNDFIFCPRSIYFHNLYGSYSVTHYHRTPQTGGRIAHAAIDSGTYSTEKRFIMGMEVYSEKFNIGGKIDIYDRVKKTLIERKKKISVIYDGYILQLYAQYFCMTEMGYPVKTLLFHSLTDNKRHPVLLPDSAEEEKFASFLESFRNYDLNQKINPNPAKCKNCIYSELCDVANLEETCCN